MAADDLGVVDADQIDGRAGAAGDVLHRAVVPVQIPAREPFGRRGCNSSSSPTATLPEATVPVTTVPWPGTVNERSIAMRNRPGSDGGVSPDASGLNRGFQLSPARPR